MNWYKKALFPGFKFPSTTMDTRFDVSINMSVGELLAIDKFLERNVPTGTYERAAIEILLRIVRANPEVFRMNAEGKIKNNQASE